MTPLSPEALAARLATMTTEQANTSRLVGGLVNGQAEQGKLLERLVVGLEAQEDRRKEQRDRCASHSSRLRDLEIEQATLKDLPEEVVGLRETVGKRGFMAAVFSGVATVSVLLVKYFITSASQGGKPVG